MIPLWINLQEVQKENRVPTSWYIPSLLRSPYSFLLLLFFSFPSSPPYPPLIFLFSSYSPPILLLFSFSRLLQVLTETKKQHRGLRCSRCFSLLCRDDDFEYMNGQLNVTGEALKSSWDGLIMRGGMVCFFLIILQLYLSYSPFVSFRFSVLFVDLLSQVYCQKMHLVGYKKHVTFTNKSKSVVALKVEKTTFTENYTNKYAKLFFHLILLYIIYAFILTILQPCICQHG